MKSFVLLAVFILPTYGLAQRVNTEAIVSALQNRQFDHALELIHDALRQSPKDAKLLTFEGIALSATGKKQEALSAYSQALQAAPNNLAALEGAAELTFAAKNKQAIPLLSRIVTLQPNNTTAHAMLAVMAYQQHDCATSVKHFEAAQTVIATQPQALGAYGSCLMRLQRTEDAIPVFRQIAALAPNEPHARYNLAVVQLTANKTQEAVETLQPLLDSSNPDTDIMALASAAYENLGDTPHAVALLRQAIVASPKRPKYYVDFATLSYNHNSFQVGIDMLNAGLTQLPKAAELYTARGILYIQMGQYDKGSADFETAHRLDPSQASAQLAEGLAQMQQSKLDEALKTVETQLAAHPNDAFLHYLKAEIISRNGDAAGDVQFKTAIESATRAVQLKPDFTLAQDVLGNLYLKSGQVEKAIAQSRTTLRYDPTDEVALYHLLQGLRRAKDPQGEIPALNKRLAAARELNKQKETSGSKYRLYEETPVEQK